MHLSNKSPLSPELLDRGFHEAPMDAQHYLHFFGGNTNLILLYLIMYISALYYRLGSHSRCTVSMTFCMFVWSYVSVSLTSYEKTLFRIHSWGNSLEEAFEQCAMGMFGYMTDTETVEPLDTVDIESEGQSSQFKWSCIAFMHEKCCCQTTN